MSAVAAVHAGAPGTPLASALRLYAWALLGGLAVTSLVAMYPAVDPARFAASEQLLLAIYPVQDLLMLAGLVRIGGALERGRGLARAAAVITTVALLFDLVALAARTVDTGYLAAALLQTVSAIVLLSLLRMTARRAGRGATAAWCLVLQLAMVPATAALMATLAEPGIEVWALASIVNVLPWVGVGVLCLRAAHALPARRSA